jgi:DNA recombination protein RmuC
VLSNKQSRGAFGQAQMEEIVRDGLPPRFTTSSSPFPTATARLHHPHSRQQALLVIDSKFPLEGFDLLRNAATDEDKKTALAQVRATVTKHVGDIAEKYLIPGECRRRPSCSCPRNRFMPTCMTGSPMSSRRRIAPM